jgi:hypothetical protein
MDITASLNSKTVAELRKLAASYNIAGRSTMKKSELVAVLAHDGLAELSIAIENIDDAAQERFAEQYRAAQQSSADADAAYIEEGIERDEAADAEAGELLDAALGEYVTPTGSQGQIAITKYSTHEAIATAAFDVDSIGGRVTRERGRWVLRDGNHTIRAKTLGKIAKLWAKKLGFFAIVIDVETMS